MHRTHQIALIYQLIVHSKAPFAVRVTICQVTALNPTHKAGSCGGDSIARWRGIYLIF